MKCSKKMKIVMKTCLKKCRNMGSKVHQECSIPKDVPKGHMVAYVGEQHTRFVVKIAILHHPLFMSLLDRAQDEYHFNTTHSKLCIPCDENLFRNVVRCAVSHNDRTKDLSMSFLHKCYSLMKSFNSSM